MSEQQMMSRTHRRLWIGYPRSMGSVPIPQIADTPGLVEGDPPGDTVAQASCDNLRIVSERIGRLTAQPTATLMQCQRQIPMVERGHRANIVSQQFIDKAIIKIQPTLIDGPHPL